MKKVFALSRIVVLGKSSQGFLFAAVLSFAFSISVILSTIGLMDGFVLSLKQSLKKSNSEYIVKSKKSFYFEKELKELNKNYNVSHVFQTQAFAVSGGKSAGVLVMGINRINHENATGQAIKLHAGEIVIGSKLSERLSLNIGDKITLAFASGKKRDLKSAILKSFTISDINSFGIFEKDLRLVYLDKNFLAQLLGHKASVVSKSMLRAKSLDRTASIEQDLQAIAPDDFYSIPYWKEYKTLIEAVAVEKSSILLILQIIVIVSVFNLIAFIVFIFEKKGKDFALLRALGLSLRSIQRFWMTFLIGLWFLSCLLGYLLTEVSDFLIQNLSFLKLPGEIYVLGNLKLIISTRDYIVVFCGALFWVLLVGAFLMYRMKRKSTLINLREEFR